MSDQPIDEWDNPEDDIFSPEFYAEVKEDLVIKKETLVFESLRTPELHNKYLRKLYRCKEKLEKIKIEHNQVQHDIEKLFTKQAPDDVYQALARQSPAPKWLNLTLDKATVTKYLTNHPDYKKSVRRLQRWQHRVEFLTKVVETINNRSYVINNAVKMIRFEHGEN